MLLRLSRFIHLIPLAPDRLLVIDAVSHVRRVVDLEVAEVIVSFAKPRDIPPPPPGSLLAGLLQLGILSEKAPDAEIAHVANLLRPFHGRDPAALLQQYRRKMMSGGDPYWAAAKALDRKDIEGSSRPLSLLLFGECDVHTECDFLRGEAARHGFDLKVAATFPDDVRLAEEHAHDAILVGALRERQTILDSPRPDAPPHATFLEAARKILTEIRRWSSAPILIDNLPEPTVQPLGMAERGAYGHRNRFRAANIALAELVEDFPDVHVVDLPVVFGAAGTERMIDDGYFGFAHFGSPGWILQRPESEKSTVHGLFPDLTPLAAQLDGDPYCREVVSARAHFDALSIALGLDRKKCVIVDLDGILWPGVLAETGSPFAWSPEKGSPHSFAGLYFGIHEALLALKRRGILLALVSKNDERTIRSLWTYDEHYPRDLLLTPEDFVSWRINWDDKVENIRAISEEIGLALDALLFIDDSPVERDRVRMRLPDVDVWGEDILGLRRRLLSDPRLQAPRLTTQSAQRTELIRATLRRRTARAEAISKEGFVASLDIQADFALADSSELHRIAELFERTTQFNTTGRRFPAAALEDLRANDNARIFVARVRDRFGDHGLVGAAIVQTGEIVGFVLSCRTLGLGVEHKFLKYIVASVADLPQLVARIVPTDRNLPVRNLYRDNGFALSDDGLWRLATRGCGAEHLHD